MYMYTDVYIYVHGMDYASLCSSDSATLMNSEMSLTPWTSMLDRLQTI